MRWHHAHDGYVGKRPGATLETRVPRFTGPEDLVEPVQAALHQLEYRVQSTPVPKGWRVQVGRNRGNVTAPAAVCVGVASR